MPGGGGRDASTRRGSRSTSATRAAPGFVHGGLVAAALDEACGLLATWYRFPAVTARIFVRYRRPVRDQHGAARRARWLGERGRRLHVDGELTDGGEVLAEARAAFLHVPLEHFLATPEGRAAADAWSDGCEYEDQVRSSAIRADDRSDGFRPCGSGERTPHVLKPIFVVAACIFALMLVDQGRPRPAHVRAHRLLLGRRLDAAAAGNGVVEACKPGKLEGRPDLTQADCTAVGIVGKLEYWRCPADLTVERRGALTKPTARPRVRGAEQRASGCPRVTGRHGGTARRTPPSAVRRARRAPSRAGRPRPAGAR